MKRMVLALTAIAMICAAPLWAADNNNDGIDDDIAIIVQSAAADEGDIAIVDTGDAGSYIERLTAIGYPVDTIGMDSDLEMLLEYSLVILPVSHASAATYANFDGLAADYIEYVSLGGGLWVGQPNPYQMPGDTADITWVPYALTLHNAYNLDDCPTVIVDPSHCITEGLPNTQFSFAGDTVLEMGPEWQVLTEGFASGMPSVFVATYGDGRILVELGHPSLGALCPPDDAALERYVSCTMGGIVGTENASWSTVKTLFR